MGLQIVPVSFREAKDFVNQHHRHNPAPRGWKFGVGVEEDGVLVGVAMAGRPVARALQTRFTLEINRVCTTGARNANSMLYAAIRRAARALGYQTIYTYTMEGESGSSLKAAGFRLETELKARKGWAGSSKQRTRQDKSLRVLLPHCPNQLRVLIWVKPFAAFKKHVNPSHAWEPIIAFSPRWRDDSMTYMRDWVAQPITLKKGLTGAKPPEVLWWLFDAINMTPKDSLADLFPGTGVVEESWRRYVDEWPSLASRINRVQSGWEMGKGRER